MHRRTFLALGTAAFAGMTLDPERLLWVPGATTFFLPPVRTVVGAAAGDVDALLTALGGPMFVGVNPATRQALFGTPGAFEGVTQHLSDEEYRLLVDRGRQMRAARRQLVVP
jgi:hypothetical protein